MPYVLQYRREMIDDYDTPQNAGELNYAFTQLCRSYLAEQGENYQHFNDIIGALENCKLEMYRRMIAPYEDKKIKENGDVY